MSDETPAVPPADQPVPEPAAEAPSAVPAPESTVPAEPVVPAAPLPPEDVIRGLLLSLVIVPAGILVFVLIWSIGFIASIVGFGVALGASFLYRLGSGGRVSIRGAFVVTGVTLVTLVLAFLAAETSSVVAAVSAQTGLSWLDVVSTPGFAGFVTDTLTAPDVIGAVLGDAALTFVFGLLGCFTVLRAAFKEARAGAAPAAPSA